MFENRRATLNPVSRSGAEDGPSADLSGMIAFASLGRVGRAMASFVTDMNSLFGAENWAIGYRQGGGVISRAQALTLYEMSYRRFLEDNPPLLERLISNAKDVYDNARSNVDSGCDWARQEAGSTHLQDIAIRRALRDMGQSFRGDRLVKVKSDGDFPELSPGNVPFIYPDELHDIPRDRELQWVRRGSVEDFWQNRKVLLASAHSSVVAAVQDNVGRLAATDTDGAARFNVRRGFQYLAIGGRLGSELGAEITGYLERTGFGNTLDRLFIDTIRTLDWRITNESIPVDVYYDFLQPIVVAVAAGQVNPVSRISSILDSFVEDPRRKAAYYVQAYGYFLDRVSREPNPFWSVAAGCVRRVIKDDLDISQAIGSSPRLIVELARLEDGLAPSSEPAK